jgi:hypothetical protein
MEVDHPLYRVLVKNTTEKDIELFNNCTMVQMATAGGQTTIRYIVSNETSISMEDPLAFNSQTLLAGNLSYIYFASRLAPGEDPGGPDIYPEWCPDPAQNYYTVGFILWFRYQGETEVRSISLPPLIHEITN